MNKEQALEHLQSKIDLTSRIDDRAAWARLCSRLHSAKVPNYKRLIIVLEHMYSDGVLVHPVTPSELDVIESHYRTFAKRDIDRTTDKLNRNSAYGAHHTGIGGYR